MAIAKPDFFIAGAPKCGTTALKNYLAMHPDIFMPQPDELRYFGSDLVLRPGFEETKTLDWYLANFACWNGEARIGEKSVWYFYSAAAPEEIKAFSPDAQIIIMLRNPVERLYSHYYQLLYNGEENLPTFEAALAAEAARKNGELIPPLNSMTRKLFYRDNACYAPYLQNYLDTFGNERVHVIIYDDFKMDPKGVYKATLEFLGVRSSFEIEPERINANKVVRNTAVRDFFRKPPSWLRNLSRIIVPKNIRSQVRPLVRRVNTVYERRPPLDSNLRRQLQRELLPDVERVSELVGRDLTRWCRDDQ